MKKNTLHYLIFFTLPLISFIFLGIAYRELTRYAELTSHSMRIYTSYEKLANQVTTAAVINPESNNASIDAEIENFFYTDQKPILQHLGLLSSTVTDSINIKIAHQLDTSIKAELRSLLKSNVSDSIIYRSSSEHIVRMNAIDSLIIAGKEQTEFLLSSGSVKLADAISNLLAWMLAFIALSGIVSVYTIVAERRKAAHKVVKNEQRFQALVKNCDTIIALADKDFVIYYHTPSLERVTGYSISDQNVCSKYDEIHPDDVESVKECHAEVKANPGRVLVTTFRFRHRDGHYIWLEATISNLLNDSIVGAILINIRNVSEQKQTEEKTRASEMSYRSLIEQASDAILVTNSNGHYIDVNPSAGKLLGYEREEVLGMTPKDILYHKEKIIDIRERLAQLSEVKSHITKNTLKKKDGTPVDVEINAIMMSEGRIVEIVRDITERKRAAVQSDKGEKRFRALIENSDDVIAMMDENMTSFYRSPSAERITGYKSDDQISGTKIDDIHPEDIEKIKNSLLELRSAPGKTIHLTYRVNHKKGHYIWLEGTFTNLFEDPNVGAIVANLRDITDRRNTELKLSQTVKEVTDYKFALDEACIVAITDQKGIITYANENFCRISKYSMDELIGQDHRIINSGHHSKEFIKSIWTTIAKGKVWRNEIKNRAKDGTYYWVDTTIIPFLNEQNKPYQYMAIRADITERKKGEERLSRTLKEVTDYKFALDESSIVAITDQTGIIKYANDNFCRISKYSRDELVGQDHRIINSGHHSKEFIKGIWTTIAKGKVWRNEIKNRAKDGTYYWVDTTIVPFLNEQNKPYQYMAIRADITERKTGEERLSQTVKEVSDYKFALDEACIVAITDQKGIITYVNQKFCAISKYSMDELIGQDHRIINSKYHSKEFIKGIWTTIANGKVWRGEIKNRAKDGSYYWVDTTIIPFLNEQHKPYQYMAIRADITERKSVEERIAANEEKLRFILDNMIEGVQIIGFDWKYAYLNNTAVMHSQYPADDLIGYTMQEKYPGFEKTDLFQLLKKTMDERVAHQVENKFIYPNGMVAWYQLSIQPVPEGVFILSVDITPRKLAEEKLISSEERFRALIENMSDAIVLNDENSLVIYQSPSVARILGYTLEERKGKPVYDFLHPNDQAGFKELYRKLKETPRFPFPFQYRFLHKNGHYVWLEGVVTNLLSEPSVKGFVANYRDITDRKEGEEKLRSERSLLRTLVDNLPDYIYVKDTQSRHILNNLANVRLMGSHGEEETLGKTVSDIMGPESARPFLEDDQRVFKSGKPVLDREETVLTSTGEVKHLLTTKVPLRDSQHNIVGLVGISRDITKQKKIELDLRNSNYFLEAAQRVGKIGHWISEIGQSGKLIWSAETCRIFGLTPEEFDGTLETFYTFVHPSDLTLLNLRVKDAIKNKRTYSIDHRITLRDKTVKWVHEQGETIVGESGHDIQLVGIVQDITERKEAENQILSLNRDLEERVKTRTAQLEVANKEMEAFTYSVSHDLRSPLRIIDGYAQILIEDYLAKLDEEGQKTLGIIMSNAKKMGQLIDDLLNFSRIGRIEIRRVKVNMNQIVDEVIQELKLAGETIPRHLKIDTLPSGNCDAGLIKHIWSNLLSNAIKYSGAKPEPEISIGTTHRDGKEIYFIKDNGAGFDMQYYHKLFGVFQRLHSHYEFSGTGVGLAIVNSIIHRHGGSIWAEAKVNEGATFYFSLD